MKKDRPTPEQLREIFSYDPDTGILRWKKKISRKVIVGSIAGCSVPEEKGRVTIGIFGHLIRAHIIIWAIMTGEYPKDQIDHRDENPGNNQWDNLREATKSQNIMNTTIRADNKIGRKGVFRRGNRFRTRLKINGKVRHFGTYDTIEEAAQAVARAADKHRGEWAKY